MLFMLARRLCLGLPVFYDDDSVVVVLYHSGQNVYLSTSGYYFI